MVNGSNNRDFQDHIIIYLAFETFSKNSKNITQIGARLHDTNIKDSRKGSNQKKKKGRSKHISDGEERKTTMADNQSILEQQNQYIDRKIKAGHVRMKKVPTQNVQKSVEMSKG